MADYPRTIVIENSKLKALIQEKTDLVLRGRELSQQIEYCENNKKAIDKEIQDWEAKVDTDDLKKRGREITEAMRAITKQMADLKIEFQERLKAHVPATFYQQYEENEKKQEALEAERNKLALKVQKKNDKIIPLGRSLMKPYIENEYEDFETLRLEDGQVIGTIFSHLETFKEHFAKRQSAQR